MSAFACLMSAFACLISAFACLVSAFACRMSACVGVDEAAAGDARLLLLLLLVHLPMGGSLRRKSLYIESRFTEIGPGVLA